MKNNVDFIIKRTELLEQLYKYKDVLSQDDFDYYFDLIMLNKLALIDKNDKYIKLYNEIYKYNIVYYIIKVLEKNFNVNDLDIFFDDKKLVIDYNIEAKKIRLFEYIFFDKVIISNTNSNDEINKLKYNTKFIIDVCKSDDNDINVEDVFQPILLAKQKISFLEKYGMEIDNISERLINIFHKEFNVYEKDIDFVKVNKKINIH